MDFQDRIIQIDHNVYNTTPGQYGVGKKRKVRWYHCREMFQNAIGFRNGFYFAIPKYYQKNLLALIQLVEDKLALKVRTKVYHTNCESVIYIELPNFWLKKITLSLFTVLCRASLNWLPKSGLDGLKDAETYTSRTYPAIERFLDGYTTCNKHVWGKTGWVDTFAYVKKGKRLESLLIKPLPLCKQIRNGLWKIIKLPFYLAWRVVRLPYDLLIS